MGEKKYGIKELTEVLNFGYAAFKAVSSALEDGKVNWLDLPQLMPIFAKAGGAIDNIAEVKNELLDLDNEEQAEVIALTRQFYEGISDQDAVILIDQTVNWVIDGFQTGMQWAAHVGGRPGDRD